MSQSILSRDDVTRLLSERSAQVRIDTATKLAGQFESGQLTDAERKLAEEIFRLMAHDAEVRVRESLAVSLKECLDLPHDVAVTLAHDVDSVALPILEYSDVLTDDDLIEIVRSQGPVKQVAIARRPVVSPEVSEALIETHNKKVVVSLLTNQGAEISEDSLQKVVDDFGNEIIVQSSLVERPHLPVSIAERLVTRVSDNLRDRLTNNYQFSGAVAAELITHSRERATILLSAGASRDDVVGLVHQLAQNGRLTPSILLRAVCMGDMAFFESGFAEMAHVPLLNAQRLIYDPGKLGFRALFETAKLPEPLFAAYRCALDVANENAFDGGELDRERFCRRMIERILTQYEKKGANFDNSDLEYLLARLDKVTAEAEA